MTAGVATERWSRRDVVALAGIVLAGILVRAVLLPTQGLRDDLDQFAGWIHAIATNGIGTLYGPQPAGSVTFGPVMAYIWAILSAVEPAFRTATDAADPAIRELMKLPASIADIGLALLIAYALRARPTWAVVGAAAILFHPAVVDVSAWWGQYESIYLLSALAAAVLAINGRNGLAAAAIAVSLMTKPQALPLLLPFAAWFWATGRWQGLARAALIGASVTIVVWLPFLAASGPVNYLHNLGEYQGGIFNILSLRAWNAWWLVQEFAAGGAFVKDDASVVGPVTLRTIGYAVAALLDLAIAGLIVRNPRPRTLALGLAASILVFFSFATQMHERYAFGALVFLGLLVAEPRARWLAMVFGFVFTLNLLAAVPPTRGIAEWLPVAGPLGIAGSVAILVLTGLLMRWLIGASQDHRAPEMTLGRGLSFPP